jgi:glyoxylase-like metal-dependent hydrolase (beta-lactamase superfamily II)
MEPPVNDQRTPASISRRQVLKGGLTLMGGAVIAPALPGWLSRPLAASLQEAADPLAQMRAQFAAVPLEVANVGPNLSLLTGPGGNVVVLNGPDGKILVDTFVQTVWDKLRKTLDGLGPAKIASAIDTHWHMDHADNNENLRKAGAAIVAHENTTKRLSQTHELFGIKFPAAPAGALPTQTFKEDHSIEANGEQIRLAYVPPAHTDTDITIRFQKANVIHLGDLFFNGSYPFIDMSTGGNINGMIAASDAALKQVDAQTKIVPGHGPLADRAALTAFRDVMVTVRDRVQKLKKEGRTVEEVVKAEPTKDLDPTWGKGFMQPAQFVTIVYQSI